MKKVIALCLSAVMLFALIGCGGGSNENETSDGGNIVDDASNAVGEAASGIAKMLQSEGRPYNSIHTGKVGDTLTNTFFDWTVHSVTVQDSFTVDGEEFLPPDGRRFVLVDITTKNVFTEINPMSNTDFGIMWEDADGTQEDIPYEAMTDEMYLDEFEEAVGESHSGLILFDIPADVTKVYITYYEIWDDEFEGDSYLIEVDL